MTTLTIDRTVARLGAAVAGLGLAVALTACGAAADEVETISAPGGGADADDRTPTVSTSTTDGDGAVAVPEGVTAERAQEIALGVVPGRVTEIELDDEDGRTVWEIDVAGEDGWEYDIDVDATTGEVVKQERDDDLDDDSDDDSDDDD